MSERPDMAARLNSWKELAAFFNTTPRTVMRWERQRGLPVHRFPGEVRSRVYADVSELRAWMAGAAPSAKPFLAEPAAPTKAQFPKHVALMIGALAVFAAVMVAAISGRDPSPPALSANARAIYDTAEQNYDRRSPLALTSALDGFTKVTQMAPRNGEGYAGLAATYAIMPQYTAMNSSEGFARAETAARRAIALDPRNARAHAILAFTRIYGALDPTSANVEFSRAIALDGSNAQIHHWYANALIPMRNFPKALSEIERAHELDPSSRAIAADRANILYTVGQAGLALGELQRLIATDPEFRSPHRYLGEIAFERGDDATFVRERRITAQLQSDHYALRIAEAAQSGLSGGHKTMLEAMRQEQINQFNAGMGGAVEIARICARLNDFDCARRFLKLGYQRGETATLYVQFDPFLKTISG